MIDPVKELKEALDLGFSVQRAISKSIANDGKLNWKDAPNVVPVLGKIGKGINGTVDAVKEYRGLSIEQKAELVDYVGQEFDIDDEQLEALIEDTLLQLQTTIDLAVRWKEYRRAA